MATIFGRFEIQSEIAQSETARIYKALDSKSNQVVALKTQSLAPLGERAKAFVNTLMAEGEQARELASQNIVALYGAGEIDGQFAAAMEYIQGNSVATMLARKEGFSIWDLLDISRQLGAALQHADAAGVVHSSLEPAKIMVQWDGLVKVLGYGISNMSLIGAETGNGLGSLMPYCSPEQIRGEAIDQRSNLFTLGTILYEMVAGRKAFDASDPVVLVGQIENETPTAPEKLHPKVQPAVSAVIMKALAKDPGARYQTARELVEDIEKCKDSGKKAATTEPKKAAAGSIKIDPATRAAAAAKFTTSFGNSAEPAPVAPNPASAPQARAAAASAGQSSAAPISASGVPLSHSAASSTASGTRLIEDPQDTLEIESGPAYSASSTPDAVLSASAVEQIPETHSPRIAVDPMMAGGASSSSGTSFSDISELPPLKEPVYTPQAYESPACESHESLSPSVEEHRAAPALKKEEAPRIQPGEIAQKVFNQIATIPPRLMLFSIFGALSVIVAVAVGLFVHVHNQDDGQTAVAHPIPAAAAPQTDSPAASPAQAPASTLAPAPTTIDVQPPVAVRPVERRTAPRRASAPAPMPQIVPGQAFVDSTPEGAEFQLDGKSDPSWVTPFNLTGLTPGKHIVVVSKNGYGTEIRSVDVEAAGKSSLVIHLSSVNALVVVNSTPAGADITLDGRPTGRVTPAQFAVEKGSHMLLLKKQGFLDETTTADLGPGQNFQYAPALRALGNADDIRSVGRFQKLFRGGADSTVGMGTVAIRTSPRGAQIAINQRVLDKLSPTSVAVGPGNYVVDITLTGFKPIHKVISVEKAGRIQIDEILERE